MVNDPKLNESAADMSAQSNDAVMATEPAVAAKRTRDHTMMIAALQNQVHIWSRSKGWWEGFDFTALPRALAETPFAKPPNMDQAAVNYIASKLLMIGTEVSEAAEALRVGDFDSHSPDGKPEGLKSELADIIIRVVDLAAALGMDMEHALTEKMAYNHTRPYRHGNKAL